ncbi:MAG: START domain-containing protein, partial [Desulfobulbaceae bacterium]|nr:START domain-containing protein [Desulfobulbaceae bacterium]
KEIPGSKVFPLKGVTILNAQIVKVLTLMLDDDRATEWIDLLAEIKLIRTYSDSRYILLYEMDSPLSLFVKKRDFLLESNFTYHKKEETVTLSLHSVEDDSVPEQKGYVRGDIYKSEWNFTALEKEGKTLVSLEYHVDPRGLTPKWLVRAFQKSWPHKTLKKLDRYLQEEAIDANPILYDLAPDLMR